MTTRVAPADRLSIALAQISNTVGDVAGNAAAIRNARLEASRFGADLVVFSELFLSGYPPEDLVLKPAFQEACRLELEALARETADGGPALLVGTPWVQDGACYNALTLLDQGVIKSVRFKAELPNYGVFDEKRVFRAGRTPGALVFRGVRLGVPICEDIWLPDIVECLAETGAELLIAPNGSPFWRGKHDERIGVAVARVAESGLPLIYLNQVGGQDELVFDGGSFALHADNTLALQLPAFRETLAQTVWERRGETWVCAQGPRVLVEEGDEADYAACTLGLRDYVAKNGFSSVVMGLSGGIDSALCAAIAADALGPERVHCVMLPYRFTSRDSLEDAERCARALGVRYDTLAIASAVEGLEASLEPLFAGLARDTTEENMQSRIRGALLMSISNKFGAMLVTTGNKSEMSMGYATLYGDMNGGFNPIKDLYKTQVFNLARLRNRWRPQGGRGPSGEVIPQRIIDKPPSAELRENQKDEDLLPPYDILDDILECLVEREMRTYDIVARGHDAATVAKVERLLYLAEYKRRQSAPGVKVTKKSFGRDRRYPIVNRFRDLGGPATAPDASLAPSKFIGSSQDSRIRAIADQVEPLSGR